MKDLVVEEFQMLLGAKDVTIYQLKREMAILVERIELLESRILALGEIEKAPTD